MPKRVLHVITTINRGGAENHLAELVRGQITHGWTVAVAYLKGNGYWAESLTGAGAEVFPLGLGTYGNPLPALRLRKLVRAYAPDILHAHMPPAELYLRLALSGHNRSIPLVVSKHNDEPFFRCPGWRLIGRWCAAGSRRVVAISEAVGRFVQAEFGIPSARISVIHYGIDPRPYASVPRDIAARLRQEWGCGDDTLVVGTVARLVPQKALHILLRGYAEWLKNGAPRSKLVIIGTGPLEAELRKVSAALGLAEYVVWGGFREDIPAAMNAFDLFALTSQYEGFGLVLLEAMAAGLPVVAAAVSAIPEVVKDGTTGILFSPGDPGGVATALKAMEDGTFRAQTGAAGRERVGRHFTMEGMLTRTLDLYADIIAEQEAG